MAPVARAAPSSPEARAVLRGVRQGPLVTSFRTRFVFPPATAAAFPLLACAVALAVLSGGCAAGGGANAFPLRPAYSSRSGDPRISEQVGRFRAVVLKRSGSRLGKGGEEAIGTFDRAMTAIALSSADPVPPSVLGDAAVRSLQEDAADDATTPDEMVDLAIVAMLKAGDPDGSYVRDPRAAAPQADKPARPGGVGLELKIRDGALTVISAVPGAPAAREGIAAGDRIVAVNGEGTAGLSLSSAVERLRGDVGSMVTLTAERRGDDTRQFTMERVVVQLRTATLVGETPRCAAIRVSQFGEGTAGELAGVLAGVRDAEGLVIDLRGNGGGLMSSVVASADLFLESGRIAKVSARGAAAPTIHAAQPGGPATRVPLALLVDGETAAGAEIFAAALRDNGRAHLLGSRTAGHGTIQTMVPLGNDAFLQLTTSKVSTAGGQPVSAGLMPEVALETIGVGGGDDPLMEKALDLLDCSGDSGHRGRQPEEFTETETQAPVQEREPAPPTREEPEIGPMPHRLPAQRPPASATRPAAPKPAPKPSTKPWSKPAPKPVDDSDNSPADI